jgi:hypothetical protein
VSRHGRTVAGGPSPDNARGLQSGERFDRLRFQRLYKSGSGGAIEITIISWLRDGVEHFARLR